MKARSIITRRLALAGIGAAAFGCVGARRDSIFVRLVTDRGDILLRLYADKAPATVANFLKYADAGLYEGGSFYRTVRPSDDVNPVPINVIQGGLGKHTDRFAPIDVEGTNVTGLSHTDGVVSMARQVPGWPVAGATSEFFICVGDNAALDYDGGRNGDGLGFAAFGQVVEGMDVVRDIHRLPTGPGGEGTNWAGQMLENPVGISALNRMTGPA